MKVLFTGATGVLGRATIPRLISAGHDVRAVARSEKDRDWLEKLGARATKVDLFDGESIIHAVSGADTVVHFATSIPPLDEMPKRKSWEMNDRLRSEATNLLVDASIAEGASRFIQQSVTFFYADGADDWLDEGAAIAPPWDVLDSALDAEAHVERFKAAGGDGVVLRLGRLYGPGKASGDYVQALRSRRMPIVGSGDNYVSSLHTEDAATSVLAALTAPAGIYNVTDDEPFRSGELTEAMARAVGASSPRRVPAWMARLVAGKSAGLLTTSQRVSNRKLKELTGWSPAYPSAVDGWERLLDRSATDSTQV